MARRALIAGWLVAGCAVLSHPLSASPLIATSKKPAQHCVGQDAETLRALKRGDKRVVVVVKSFQPAKSPANLVVKLVPAGKSASHEVTQFAVHPLRAMSAKEPGKQQRFLVSLDRHAHLIDDKQPLCLEIGFDSSKGDLEGGAAEFDVEVTDVMAAGK